MNLCVEDEEAEEERRELAGRRREGGAARRGDNGSRGQQRLEFTTTGRVRRACRSKYRPTSHSGLRTGSLRNMIKGFLGFMRSYIYHFGRETSV